MIVGNQEWANALAELENEGGGDRTYSQSPKYKQIAAAEQLRKQSLEASLGKRGDVVLRDMKKMFKKGGNTKRNQNLRNSSVPQISSRDNPVHRSTKSSVMQ